MFRTKGLNKKYHKRVIYDKKSRDPGGGGLYYKECAAFSALFVQTRRA